MMELIKEDLTTDKNRNNILEICKNQKNIVLIPAGYQAISFAKYLKQYSIYVDYFVDNDPKKQGTIINDIQVLSFPEFKKISHEKFLIIATNQDIKYTLIKQIEENAISNYTSILTDYTCYDVNEIDNAKEIILNKFEKYSRLYNMLADNLSKKTLLNRLNYLITHDTAFLEEIKRPVDNQYFEPDIYNISSKDYFVDCGAYDGDTLDQLMKKVNFNISCYYGFEPDDKNYLKLSQKAENYNNVSLFKKGVYKKDAILRFNTNNSASQISNDGNVEIDVVSLDSVFKNQKVSFIKMDIEGGEKEALLGAKNVIISQKPVLSISVYHKFDDIYEIPFLIDSFGVEYQYYLRHYTLDSGETVLYTVYK